MSSLQARTLTTRSAGSAVDHSARLELLEYYLAHHEDIVGCARATLEWLARHAGIRQSACLAVDAESNMLVGIASQGVVGEDIELFSWPLSDSRDPLIVALQSAAPVQFKAARVNGHDDMQPVPLGRGPFVGIPLGTRYAPGEPEDTAPGLLLL